MQIDEFLFIGVTVLAACLGGDFTLKSHLFDTFLDDIRPDHQGQLLGPEVLTGLFDHLLLFGVQRQHTVGPLLIRTRLGNPLEGVINRLGARGVLERHRARRQPPASEGQQQAHRGQDPEFLGQDGL